MKKVVVFTGAGISVESGLATFRGGDGLWEGHRVEDVATPEAWRQDRAVVLEFYNQRRRDCLIAEPNAAHHMLAELENKFDVQIITQNVDDLHERAGSTNVLHLHGEIRKSQSSLDPDLVYRIQGDRLDLGQRCELGSQLRPHVVWFGEPVPNMLEAMKITRSADFFITIGTSLQVYPAANLMLETGPSCQVVLIDPNAEKYELPSFVTRIPLNATIGVGYLAEMLTQ
ncbi:MAG: Sir2 family NAD-dependent protein deacetylase [Sphingobacteriaceae bacterium]